MSRRNVLIPQKIASAQSLSASFVSVPTMIPYGDNVSYQINVTTTDSQGSFYVQVSNDYSPNTPDYPTKNAGNWATLTLSGNPSVSSTNDVITLNLNQVPYKAIRLGYTSTVAGTGVCDIFVGYKDLA